MSLEKAQDPRTHPAKLDKLFKSKDPEVLASLAKNPNTPRDTLLALAEKFPVEFLENPALPILLLETPNLLSMASLDTWAALLSLPTAPDWVAQSMLSHPQDYVRQSIAQRKEIPPELLAMLALD